MKSDSIRAPLLFCFAGPGGCGKSSICRRLVEQDPNLMVSISTTTRKPRPNEQPGVHYYFVEHDEFEQRIGERRFLEHARFGQHRYGTERVNLERAAEQGQDLLLDIDVQGVEQVHTLHPQQTVVIFVFPPSFGVLAERMRSRGSEDEEKIGRRLEIGRQEVARLRQPTFSDYLLINDSLDDAVKQAHIIVQAERLRLWHHAEAELDALLNS